MSGLLIAAILFPIAGCITGRRPLPESFLLGLGVVGGAEFLLGLFHVPFVVTIAIVLVAGLLGLVYGPASAGHDRLKPLPALLAVIPLVALAVIAAIVPLNDFDGRGFWLLKAKALAHERAIDGPFFHGEVVNDPKNQYPLLLPLDAATVMIVSGDSDDRQVRWIYVFTFAALVFVIAERVNPWCAAILSWIPQFTVAEGGTLTAYSDIALAAFIACAFLELIRAESPIRFGLWLAFLVLTKNEGLPIALILLAIGMKRWKTAILPMLLSVAALLVWRSRIPKTDEEDYLRLLSNLHWNRFFPALIAFARHAFDFSNWGLFWVAATIALGVLVWRKEWRAPAVIASILLVYIGAYMVTQWNLRDLVNVSADRLLMHLTGPALFAIAQVTDAFGRNRYAPPRHPPQSV